MKSVFYKFNFSTNEILFSNENILYNKRITISRFSYMHSKTLNKNSLKYSRFSDLEVCNQ